MTGLLSSAEHGFASGAAVVADALKAFLPPEPTNVADFAAAHRWLSNEGGGYVGRWSHEEAPYLIAPMEALSGEEYLTVAVVGPGQCGKSEIARNWLLTTVLSDPADMLWYSGSEPLVTSEVKGPIAKLLQDHKAMRELLRDNSLAFKRFGPMKVEFLAGIMNNFVAKTGPRIVADEWDIICAGVPAAKALLDVRRQTFKRRSKLLALSHPDLVQGYEERDWELGIMALFRDSTRNIWFWPCPSCGAWSSPVPTANLHMAIHYDETGSDEEIEAGARLLCPVNGCLIEDSQRRGMNLRGKWVGQGQQIDQDGVVTGERVRRDIDGYWIVGAMSLFTLGGIGGLAVDRARAERQYAIDGERKPLAQTLSKRWGIMLDRKRELGEIDAGTLAARADKDLVLGSVANGVRFITVFVDVQGNRFELMARGWCADGTSTVVDFRRIDASPGTSGADWDDLLAFATTHAWPLADGTRRGMRAMMVGYDTSGVPGVTLQAYNAWKRLKAARAVRPLGRIDGRPAFNVLPMKGASTANPPRLSVVFPDAVRGDRFAQARGEVPVGIFAPNAFKDDLNDQLAIADGATGFVRFPAALGKPPISPTENAWFEQLLAEARDKSGRWEPRRQGHPNEALDLMVGTHVLAFALGLRRIRWDAGCPPWARPWEQNANVVPLGGAAAAAATTVAAQERGQGGLPGTPATVAAPLPVTAPPAATRPVAGRVADRHGTPFPSIREMVTSVVRR
jgi:phage terminase large subunit GpA-like protein